MIAALVASIVSRNAASRPTDRPTYSQMIALNRLIVGRTVGVFSVIIVFNRCSQPAAATDRRKELWTLQLKKERKQLQTLTRTDARTDVPLGATT